MELKFKFKHGQTVKEKITGFQGVITGVVSYITGCNQYLVVAKAKTNKEKADSLWVDEDRLKLMKKAIVTITEPVKIVKLVTEEPFIAAVSVSAELDPIFRRRRGSDIEAPNKG